jgi:hypothetical protein
MEYLAYIDPFIYAIFWFIFLYILMVGLVFWLAKGFAWFLNEVFDLKKTEDKYNYYDKY